MSFFQFSEDQYAKTFDNDEEVRMGSFQTVESGQLGHIRALIIIKGVPTLTGNEQLQMKIYNNENTATDSLMFSSNLVSLSDISTEIPEYGTKDSFIGWLRFDFNRQNINKELEYFPTLTISNYARNFGDRYVAASYDFPFPVYDNGETQFFKFSLAMQIFDYRVKRLNIL